MAFLIKPLLCVGCLAGASFAVGVPIALTLKNSRDNSSELVNSNGATSSINLVQCTNLNQENQEIIKYGSRDIQDICGFVNTSTGNQKIENNEQKHTNLFKNMGDHKNSNGSTSGGNYGKNQCQINNKTGYLSTSDGEEYLGICDNSDESKKQGVTIENKNTDELKIEVCQGECGNKGSDNGSNVQVFSVKKIGNGKEVKFKKNS